MASVAIYSHLSKPMNLDPAIFIKLNQLNKIYNFHATGIQIDGTNNENGPNVVAQC